MIRSPIMPRAVVAFSPAPQSARVLTGLLILLCILIAVVGLFVPGVYHDSPSSIPLQHGNDLAALLVGVPLLVVSLHFAARGSLRGYFLWLGGLGWAVYLGAIDAFSLQFNALFLAYVAILGRGIPVEPSHVLDLGLLLPTSILGGILLIRRHPWGYLLAGICLALLVPLLTAINLAPIFQLAAGQSIALGPVAAYAIILILNLAFTWLYLKGIRGPSETDRRR